MKLINLFSVDSTYLHEIDQTVFYVSACEVYFDNTPVPAENVLGEVGGGFKVGVDLCH